MNDLVNQTLLVAVKNIIVFKLLKMGNELVGVKGRDFKILQALSSKMRFNYVLVTPDDGQFGSCDDKGNCSGMIGMVARQEADMALADISYTPSRARNVDFSYPYFYEDVTFATKKINDYQDVNSYLFFSKPLDRRVWILLASFLVISVLVIKIMECFELLKTKIMSVQTMVQIILRQSVNLNRNENKQSVVMLLVVFVVTAGCTCKLYECMLTSATSMSPVTPPIDTISDMVDAIKNRHYVISAMQGNAYQEQLMTSEVEYMKLFAQSSLNIYFVAPQTPDECVEMLLNERYAILTTGTAVRWILLETKLPIDTLHRAKDVMFMDYVAVALGKQFPCRDDLNKWLNVLVDSGLINKWHSEIHVKSFNQSTTSFNHVNKNYIGLKDLKLIFLILLSGYTAGLASLLIEKIFIRQSMVLHNTAEISLSVPSINVN